MVKEEFEQQKQEQEEKKKQCHLKAMKKNLYGELVRENFYPSISEKKKNERIANIISPK